MGKKKHANKQSEKTSSEEPTQPATPTLHYMGGSDESAAQIYSHFWVHQLAGPDRLELIRSVSNEALLTELYLNNLHTEGISRALVARAVGLIVHSLEHKDGKIDAQLLNEEFHSPVDQVVAWIVVSLIEQRITELMAKRRTWVKLFAIVAYLLWIVRVGWLAFGSSVAALAWICFSAYAISVRKYTYTNVLLFFHNQSVNPAHIGILWFGMHVAIANELSAKGFIVGLNVCAILLGLGTKYVVTPASIRTLSKLSTVIILLLNITLVGSAVWTYGISLRTLVIAALFNWSIVVSVGAFGLLVAVVVGAFLKDIILGLRQSKTRRTLGAMTAVAVSLSLWFNEYNGVFKYCLIAVGIGAGIVGIPAIGNGWSNKAALAAALCFDGIHLLFECIQTIAMTVTIFTSSWQLGIKWILYLINRVKNVAKPS